MKAEEEVEKEEWEGDETTEEEEIPTSVGDFGKDDAERDSGALAALAAAPAVLCAVLDEEIVDVVGIMVWGSTPRWNVTDRPRIWCRLMSNTGPEPDAPAAAAADEDEDRGVPLPGVVGEKGDNTPPPVPPAPAAAPAAPAAPALALAVGVPLLPLLPTSSLPRSRACASWHSAFTTLRTHAPSCEREKKAESSMGLPGR